MIARDAQVAPPNILVLRALAIEPDTERTVSWLLARTELTNRVLLEELYRLVRCGWVLSTVGARVPGSILPPQYKYTLNPEHHTALAAVTPLLRPTC